MIKPANILFLFLSISICLNINAQEKKRTLSTFREGKVVTKVGNGFSYLLARKLGARMGMDFAISNDDFAFYIIFGTAWLK